MLGTHRDNPFLLLVSTVGTPVILAAVEQIVFSLSKLCERHETDRV